MEARDIVQKGNMFHAKFDTSVYTGVPFTSNTSPEFIIKGIVSFQVQISKIRVVSGYASEYTNLIFVKFNKINRDDNARYNLRLSSIKFDLTDKIIISDDSTWRLIHEWKTVNTYSFDITVFVETFDTVGTFAALLDDEELTDFSLRGADGSVRVHKVVLAASSPVLKRLLLDKWKESREGCLDIPKITSSTLSQLKNYMYTRVVPETGLEWLLMLSTHYMMRELEQKCIDRIISSLNAHNTLMISEFAIQNKMTRLHLAILDCIQSGAVKVEELSCACYKEQRVPEKIETVTKKSRLFLFRNRSQSVESHSNVSSTNKNTVQPKCSVNNVNGPPRRLKF